MSKSTWRTHAGQVIATVIEEVGTDDKGRLKRALFDAYPYGVRKYWPYKVWLDEIRKQLKVGVPEPSMPLFKKEVIK